MAKIEKRPCAFAGCEVLTGGSTGYCPTHHKIAFKCSTDGCENRVAAHSRSRCCKAHRVEGVRLLRKAFKPWG